MKLNFSQVTKSFGGLNVIKQFDTSIADGEIVALVGPSGCGKSTLLHMLAGLQQPSSGSLTADGNSVAKPSPERTLVFQEHALYPWMTLRDNVSLALEFQDQPRKQSLADAEKWLARVQLTGFEDYYPHQVSGGMRQRCALARAFIARPKVLLLDEPFGALDALTRMTLQSVLKDLIEEERPTVVLVTHDVDEALYLADRVMVFSQRPATILKEVELGHLPKTHDLSVFADVRREVLNLLGLAVSSPATAAEEFRVGYVRVMDDAQAMLAYEAGLYEKYGLDAELIEFTSGTDLIKGIVGGQLDIGVLGFSNAFTWASKGADLKIVGGAQRGYHAMLVRDDAGIDSIEGLKGKNLASQKQGSTADIVLKGVTLAEAGLAPSDLNIMGVAPSVAIQSLVGGRVDAAFLFEPYASIAKLVAPVKEIYEIGEVWPFPCMVVITSGETLEKRKDVLWAALDAQRDAIEMLENNPEEAAPYITDYFIREPVVKSLNQGEIASEKVITDAIKTNDFSARLTGDDISRMKELAGIMQEQNILQVDGEFDVDALLDLSWQQDRGL